MRDELREAETAFRQAHDVAYEAFRVYYWNIPSLDQAAHFRAAAECATRAAVAFEALAEELAKR